MNARTDTERILDAYLAPEADRLADRVIDAALADIDRTPQRRALRVPWRFPSMPALTRATGIAAVALVAVGAASLLYLNSKAPGGPGGLTTASPTLMPTTAPSTTQPSVATTPGCSEVAPGICGWETYTSAVYGYTISYPQGWSVGGIATGKWQPGASDDDAVDTFTNNDAVDGDSIAYFALQFPGPAGADLGTWDGLLAALTEMCATPDEFYFNSCPTDIELARMCLGTPGCQPVAFVTSPEAAPRAIFGDPVTGLLPHIVMGREDDFPAAARYGGTEMLLKSILSQLGVREPGPGDIPS